MSDNDEKPDFYGSKTDMEIARHINLALLMCEGISDRDAGFDVVTSINEAGLVAIARIIGQVRKSAAKTEVAL